MAKRTAKEILQLTARVKGAQLDKVALAELMGCSLHYLPRLQKEGVIPPPTHSASGTYWDLDAIKASLKARMDEIANKFNQRIAEQGAEVPLEAPESPSKPRSGKGKARGGSKRRQAASEAPVRGMLQP